MKQAALLGAPGAGKSTTLRKLAVDLARRAAQDPEAPLPLLVSLGFWLGEEDLAGFLRTQLPEIGWLATALAEPGRLILLLDGMSEVPTTQRKIKAEQIRVYRGGAVAHVIRPDTLRVIRAGSSGFRHRCCRGF